MSINDALTDNKRLVSVVQGELHRMTGIKRKQFELEKAFSRKKIELEGELNQTQSEFDADSNINSTKLEKLEKRWGSVDELRLLATRLERRGVTITQEILTNTHFGSKDEVECPDIVIDSSSKDDLEDVEQEKNCSITSVYVVGKPGTKYDNTIIAIMDQEDNQIIVRKVLRSDIPIADPITGETYLTTPISKIPDSNPTGHLWAQVPIGTIKQEISLNRTSLDPRACIGVMYRGSPFRKCEPVIIY